MAARFDSGSLETYGAVQSTGAEVTVPDAALLFTGDYSRSGTDLTITGSDGAKFVVAGYFETDTPPSLMSPTGGGLTGDVVTALAGPQYPGMYAQAGGGAASAAKEIGKVQTLEGSGTVVRTNGVTETLKVGDPVYEGDVVMTGPASKMGIGFVDGTVFSMSASARMVLNSLIYDANGSDNSMLFSLVEGSFVFAAGQIAPTGDMKIQTPVATMGIRGTAPTVDIIKTALGNVVNFSIVPDPDDGHIGNYTLYNTETGAVIGNISSTGSTWSLNVNGTITEFDKSEDDLLRDAEAINQINNVYNTYQTNTQNQQNPQAGPENNPPPSSGGFNTNPNQGENVDGSGQNNGGGEQQQQQQQQDDSQPGNNAPPSGDQTNNDPPPVIDDPEDPGVNVINGTEFDDNGEIVDGVQNPPALVGTNGNDFIYGHAGDDHITALGGDDFVFAGDGDDTIVGATGAGDDFYDGGEGTDTAVYTSTNNDVIVNLVDSTVQGNDIGIDTIASLERFVMGGGNDTLIVNADTGWFFDGGDGIDTIQIAGDLNIDTATMQSDAINVEVIDMGNDDANTLTMSVDDFIDPQNDTGTIQIRGNDGDKVVLTNLQPSDPEADFPGGFYQGSWQLAGTTELDGVDYNIYLFFEPQSSVPLGIAQIEVGVDVVEQSVIETVQDVFQEPDFGNDFTGLETIQFASFDSTETGSSYSLNNGSVRWLSGWQEINDDHPPAENGDPDDGEIFISNDPATSPGNQQLTLTDNDLEAGSPDFIQRSADLSGAAKAVLSFNFRRVDMEENDDIHIYAFKPDQNPQLIGTISGTGTDDETYQTATFDITAFISSDTTIRFGVDDLIDNGDTLYVDNVTIFQYGPEQVPANMDVGPNGLFDSILLGTLDNDEPEFDDGNELALGFRGDDTLVGLEGNDVLIGGAGNDHLEGDVTSSNLKGSDILLGGPGNDTILGSRGKDFIQGDDGNDEINGNRGDDIIFGGRGKDDIRGGRGDDDIRGGRGDDTIFGGRGNDVIRGGRGDDVISGGRGNDVIRGGRGDDTLIGGKGDDILSGGLGENTFVFDGLNDGVDTITDFGSLDALDLTELLVDAFPDGLPSGQELSEIINQYVQALEDGNGNVSIGVDTNGETGGSEFTEIAVLRNVGEDVSVGINIGGNATSILSDEPVPAETIT